MKPTADVRRTNWWYVVPPADGRVLVAGGRDHADAFADHVLVPPEPEAVARALRDATYPGVAVPDLDGLIASWTEDPGALASLGRAVDPGGWLYVGFSNLTLGSRGLSVAGARRILAENGFDDLRFYLAAPDHVTPAYLIPAARRAEVDFFLRMLFFPYSEATGTKGAATRVALRLLRIGAGVSPPWLRTRSWPSIAIVARRGSR